KPWASTVGSPQAQSRRAGAKHQQSSNDSAVCDIGDLERTRAALRKLGYDRLGERMPGTSKSSASFESSPYTNTTLNNNAVDDQRRSSTHRNKETEEDEYLRAEKRERR